MLTWRWYGIAGLGWNIGLVLLGYFVWRDLWANPHLLLPLMLTWELGGLAAVGVHKSLPKRPEPGFRLFLLSILTGAMAHSAYHALRWENRLSALDVFILGPLAGGAAALISGLLTSVILESGVKQAAAGVSKALRTSREDLGWMDATRKHLRQVVEARFVSHGAAIPAELWSAVDACEDREQLDRWFEIALAAASHEIFCAAVVPPTETRN